MQLAFNNQNQELVPVTEAAARLGVCEKTIYNRMKEGLYKPHKHGHKMYIYLPKQDKNPESYNPEEAFIKIQGAFEELVKKNKELEEAQKRILEQDKTIETLRTELGFMKSLMTGFNRPAHEQKHQTPVPPWQYNGQPFC